MAIEIYTDGSCLGAPEGPGGFAAILVDAGREVSRVAGHLPATTHYRAELAAVVAGLEALPGPAKVSVHSDSQSIVEAAARPGKRRKNEDLWQRLDAAAARHAVTFLWVRGHNGHPWNSAAHRLSRQAARNGQGPAAPPLRAPAPPSPEAALALDFARACLGWGDAALPGRQAPPAVMTGLAPAPHNRLRFTDLAHVLAAVAAWCDARAAAGQAVQASVGYHADEGLYVGVVRLGEGEVEARDTAPCQALMEACVLAARQLAGPPEPRAG